MLDCYGHSLLKCYDLNSLLFILFSSFHLHLFIRLMWCLAKRKILIPFPHSLTSCVKVILIRELACITVYDGVHNDLHELNSFDANLNSHKRKPDSFDANLLMRSLKRKLYSFDPNLNILKRIYLFIYFFFCCKLDFSKECKVEYSELQTYSVDANLNSLKRKLTSSWIL